MTWVINGVSVCCSLGWTLNHEISFLLLYLLFLISQLSYFVFGTGCKIWLSKVQILYLGKSRNLVFPFKWEKLFSTVSLFDFCRSARCGYIWLGLCQATVWCTVAITHSVSTCSTWKVSLMHKRYNCSCSIFKLLQRWTYG